MKVELMQGNQFDEQVIQENELSKNEARRGKDDKTKYCVIEVRDDGVVLNDRLFECHSNRNETSMMKPE